MKKSTTTRLPLIAKIAIALTFINTWVIFEETIVDRHGLWRYMPYYRVGLFCAWDAAVLTVTLLLLLRGVARSRRRDGPTQSSAPPLPRIGKIAIALTFINAAVIAFVWPGLVQRICV
jgi:predicted secreted protein